MNTDMPAAPVAPAAPAVRAQRIAEAWASRRPKLARRLMRAVALVANVEQIDDSAFAVEGAGRTYRVKVDRQARVSQCDCEDSRRGHHCKHRLACAIAEASGSLAKQGAS